MHDKKFNYKKIHNILIEFKNAINLNLINYKVLNYIMNTLNFIFYTSSYNISNNLKQIFQNECMKYNIQYIPKNYRLSVLKPIRNNIPLAKELDNAQNYGLNYFKNNYSSNMKPLDVSDIEDIVCKLDKTIYVWAKNRNMNLSLKKHIHHIFLIKFYIKYWFDI